MNLPVQNDTAFFLLLAAGVLVYAGAVRPQFWMLDVALLVALGIVLYATRSHTDRAFSVTCAGQPLVIALFAGQVWAGLFGAWMLAGIVLSALGLLGTAGDVRGFGIFCGAALVIAAGTDAAGHVLLPLVIAGTLVAAFALACTVRAYRFRKLYAGDFA